MEKQKIVVSNKEDRQALALILIKNKYTVRIVKDNVGNKKTEAVESWRDAE